MNRQERIDDKKKKILISEHQHYDNWCSTFDFNYFYRMFKNKQYQCTSIFVGTHAEGTNELIDNTVVSANSDKNYNDRINEYALSLLSQYSSETVHTLKHKLDILTVKGGRIVLYCHPPYNKAQAGEDIDIVLYFEKEKVAR